MAVNKAVLKAMDILQYVQDSKKGVTLSEIAQHMSIPVTSASDIIKALQEKRMLEVQDPRLKTYTIGIKCFELGSSYASNVDVLSVSIPFINDLSKEVDNTIFLGKLVDERVVYLYKSESTKSSLIPTCKVGSRANLSTTGQGKLLIAHNDSLYRQVIGKELVRRTQRSITDRDLFDQELERVRTQGYAMDMLEDNDNIMCVAFPIFSNTGAVEHCLSISGPIREREILEKETAIGMRYARELSASLGYIK